MSDEIERDELECGVLFVGAGPANLAGAIRLMQLIEEHNEAVEKGAVEGEPIDVEDKPIMVIEKASEVGDHVMSGAVMDPRALKELFEDFATMDPPPPFEGPALHDRVEFLRPGGGSFVAPITPPTFNNHGNYICSLNKFVKWLAAIAEEKGIQVLPDFPGAEVLYDEAGNVRGVRTADKGVDKNGEQKGSFEPGNDLLAPVTVFGEGSRGSLTRTLIRRFRLDEGRNPQIYSTGCKELWKVPAGRMKPGEVIHTAGYPLDLGGNEFGGGFIYAFNEDHVSLGFVVSLDSPDPTLDPHRLFSNWKNHKLVKSILEGGECVRYGAKTIPEGGWFSLPRPYVPGGLLVGDSAGFLNMSRLKGIHLATKSGMLAAETAFEVLRGRLEPTEKGLKSYWKKVLGSWIYEEMWKVRNFRQSFQRKPFGFLRGMVSSGLHIGTGGLWPPGRVDLVADHHRFERLPGAPSNGASKKEPAPALPAKVDTAAKVAAERKDGVESKAPKSPPAGMPEPSVKSDGVVYDKVTDVYYSGATHEEDQPPHLVVADLDVCHTRCTEEYGNPCQFFCPANVYEMADTDDGAGRQLRLNFSNCVHCKTCDVRDPYQIITWVTPESGGPVYSGL
jgi:electron-transferring-flavoprotein dehydrogenase